VTLFCGEYKESSRHDNVDGVDIVRRGGRFTVYFWAAVYYLLQFRGRYDVIVDLENGIPFFTPLYTRTPKVCIMHHVHTEQFRVEFSLPLSWIGIFLESVAMPWLYRRVPFITISQSSRDEMARIGISPKRCSVVYCGLDHDQYRPGQAKLLQPSLICLGRLMNYKRVDMLIRLMVPVLEQCPDTVLHVAGSGPAEVRLERLVDQLGLQDHVVLHGHVSEQEKVHLLQQSWLLAIPSIREGWGLVVIEANACGTPAITFDVSGLREAVDNRRTGLLVTSQEDFVNGVCHVLRDAVFRASLTHGALEHASTFSWDETSRQTLEILSLATGKSPSPTGIPARGDKQLAGHPE
jgi:glycosyltransferase involved in cell wall biosynthesis